jgi:SHAQKYF class myb-like DNA-binding protein
MAENDISTPNSTKRLRRGWTKDEHIRFLVGVFIFGRGNWKNISQIINGKSPKQVQSHAQKYFLRQQQQTKSKRSIHDFDFADLQVLLRDQGYREFVAQNDNKLHKRMF